MSDKSPEMMRMLNQLSEATFGRSRTEALMRDVCVSCGGKATVFLNKLCEDEYRISALCQLCQDESFGYDHTLP